MNRILNCVVCMLVAVLLIVVVPGSSWAYRQNGFLNFGSTGALDAVLPPPGLYGSLYNVYYAADRFNDGNGDKLAGLDHKLDVVAVCPQFFYIFDTKIGGLTPGAQVLGGFQSFDVESPILTSGRSGLTDLCVGAFAGGNVKLTENSTLFYVFEFDTYVPIGRYDETRAVNPGSNFYTFEPFVSLTWMLPHGFEISSRIHYTVNTENRDKDETGGDAFHLNYTATKTVFSDNFRLGIHGYYLQQLEEDEVNGIDVKDSEERVFSIGPAMVLNHKGTCYNLSAMFESGVENRSKGSKIVLRIIQKL